MYPASKNNNSIIMTDNCVILTRKLLFEYGDYIDKYYLDRDEPQ